MAAFCVGPERSFHEPLPFDYHRRSLQRGRDFVGGRIKERHTHKSKAHPPVVSTVRSRTVQSQHREVRCFHSGTSGNELGFYCRSVGVHSIPPDSSGGWLLLDTPSGTLSHSIPFTPVETDGNYWLVRKPGETNGCWSYHRVKREFAAHFGPVEIPKEGFSQSRLSPDGKSRAWILAPMPPDWRGGTIEGRLILQRQSGKAEISVPIEMQAAMGSGLPVIPHDIEFKFAPDGRVTFSAREGRNGGEDHFWSIDITNGKVSSGVKPHVPADSDEPVVLGGVPVPDYLRNQVSQFRHFGLSGLAPAFLLHLGILRDPPGFPECTAGVSRDGRHVLYAAKRGPLSGFYIYGDLITKQTVRWKAPDGLDCRDAQEFVWVDATD